jgi:hypothetical protein
MESEPPKADLPKRRRRWFQFSLRSLLIFMMLISIACSWGTLRLRRALKRTAAVRQRRARDMQRLRRCR